VSRSLLLQRVELHGRLQDVRVADGLVSVVTAAGQLSRQPGEALVDGHGGALLPGLADHHLHLLAAAASLASLDCSAARVGDRAGLSAALRSATPGADGWVRAVGYDGQLAGPLTATTLDELLGEGAPRLVRVQDRSGAAWSLSGAAAHAIGLQGALHPGVERGGDGRATGRLFGADDWLRDRLPPTGTADVATVGTLLARYGVTAVTDATAGLGDDAVTLLADAHAAGLLPQRLHLLGAASVPVPLSLGPSKIMVADAALPALADLAARVAASHERGRPVAVHCVTREALLLLLSALDLVGILEGDRVEHAAVVPRELMPRLRGLRVVTQPAFLTVRGESYRRDVDPRDLPGLYPYSSLLAAGVPVVPSSDAPFGPLDPWAVICAARDRRTERGTVLGAREQVSPRTALAGLLSPVELPGAPPRRVTVGGAADFCVLSCRLEEALRHPSSELVAATVIAGDIVHTAGS